MVVFLAAADDGVALGDGVGVDFIGSTTLSCTSFTAIFGEENVKPLMDNFTQPFFSLNTVVAILEFPSALVMETLARKGAEVNL